MSRVGLFLPVVQNNDKIPICTSGPGPRDGGPPSTSYKTHRKKKWVRPTRTLIAPLPFFAGLSTSDTIRRPELTVLQNIAVCVCSTAAETTSAPSPASLTYALKALDLHLPVPRISNSEIPCAAYWVPSLLDSCRVLRKLHGMGPLRCILPSAATRSPLPS